jgi:hypothetical protein
MTLIHRALIHVQPHPNCCTTPRHIGVELIQWGCVGPTLMWGVVVQLYLCCKFNIFLLLFFCFLFVKKIIKYNQPHQLVVGLLWEMSVGIISLFLNHIGKEKLSIHSFLIGKNSMHNTLCTTTHISRTHVSG